MERRQLEIFLAIAEAGSFTRAAARLRVAQPSLSYAIRTLETEVGTALFERLGRGVRLTPAGEALAGPARRTLRSFEIAQGAVRAISEEGFGRLTLVASTMWAVEPLVGVLAEFRRVQPRVRLVVRDPRHRSDVLDLIRSGEADLGLLDGPPPAGAFASLFLAEHELVGILPPGSEPSSDRVDVAELVRTGLIATPAGTALRALVDERLEAAGLPGEVAVETAHVASVVPLVVAGAGAALLSEGLASAALAEGARLVRLDPPSRARVYLVWRDGDLDPVAAQLLSVVRDGLAHDG